MSNFDRKLLLSGDKVLFHTKGLSPMSMGIRYLTQSFWNHIGQYEEEVNKKGYVVEALGRGVVKTPIEKYINNKNYVLKAIRLNRSAFKDEDEYKQGLQTSRKRIYEKIGTKYDWWAIGWLGAKYIFGGWFRKIPVNLFQHRQKFFCSELVCEADYGISSLHPRLYAGKTNATCSTTTPGDFSHSPYVIYITGEVDRC